ncbi:hypothetical protein DPV78_000511 [Talaromyces pinophilus]|nr:hypothetical protein DPV78_000511 [Talaromyces pinophilus]
MTTSPINPISNWLLNAEPGVGLFMNDKDDGGGTGLRSTIVVEAEVVSEVPTAVIGLVVIHLQYPGSGPHSEPSGQPANVSFAMYAR